jgi:SpoVK/Ycf46/Vps4 family AAA+-type ATPase
MGYLIAGRIGTGKTFLVQCWAGELGIPCVVLKNFRDRWVGSSEGNLEKIIGLVRALGRCMVFIDEADQALGRRTTDSGDSGLSGRIYAMIAQEMGDSSTRCSSAHCCSSFAWRSLLRASRRSRNAALSSGGGGWFTASTARRKRPLLAIRPLSTKAPPAPSR